MNDDETLYVIKNYKLKDIVSSLFSRGTRNKIKSLIYLLKNGFTGNDGKTYFASRFLLQGIIHGTSVDNPQADPEDIEFSENYSAEIKKEVNKK